MPPNVPFCPRCGYDQSGVAATWQSACPLVGRCSECGLDFHWADIFRPDRERILGFFEHANTPRRFLTWMLTTLVWTLLPWVFWRRVTVFTRPNYARMLVWLALVMLLPHIAGSILATGAHAVNLAMYTKAPTARPALDILNAWLSPIAGVEWWSGELVLDPSGWVRGMLFFSIFCAAWPLMFLLLRDTMRACRVRRAHILRAAGYSLAWLPVLGLLRLVDRGALLAFAIGGLQDLSAAPLPSRYLWRLGSGAPLLMLLWVALWWWFAINRGFRLTHGWAVWALFLLASILTFANGVLLIMAVSAMIQQAGF